LTVSEIKVLMRMFGLKDQKEEAAITNCINMRFMIFTLHEIIRWAHMGEMKNVFKILVGNPEVMKLLRELFMLGRIMLGYEV
jgi:hypothetical protein